MMAQGTTQARTQLQINKSLRNPTWAISKTLNDYYDAEFLFLKLAVV